MNKKFVKHLQVAKKNKEQLLAILLDPDKLPLNQIREKVVSINNIQVDYILVGGSLLFTNFMDAFVIELKKYTTIPIILFPSNAMHISKQADGILFLTLISGRNPEFLVGNQVIAAPLLQHTKLEVIPTSYLLIESGKETTASYISNTKPIPRHKPEIAMATALAGEFMGHKITYLDGGSGAQKIIPKELIKQVAKQITNPIIIGGGIKSRKELDVIYNAGATMVVIGDAFEKDSLLLEKL